MSTSTVPGREWVITVCVIESGAGRVKLRPATEISVRCQRRFGRERRLPILWAARRLKSRRLAMAQGPLRILHLTAGSDAGGLSRYIYDLSMAMIAQGHEITVGGERGAWHWL